MVCSKCKGSGRFRVYYYLGTPSEYTLEKCEQCDGKGWCTTCSDCYGTGCAYGYQSSDSTIPSSWCPHCCGSGIEASTPIEKAAKKCSHPSVTRIAVRGGTFAGVCVRCSKAFSILEMMERDYGKDAVNAILPSLAQKTDVRGSAPTGRMFKDEE